EQSEQMTVKARARRKFRNAHQRDADRPGLRAFQVNPVGHSVEVADDALPTAVRTRCDGGTVQGENDTRSLWNGVDHDGATDRVQIKPPRRLPERIEALVPRAKRHAWARLHTVDRPGDDLGRQHAVLESGAPRRQADIGRLW